VEIFNIAKNHVENNITSRNLKIIGGFICPSSDLYVQQKLKQEAFPLKYRNKMCELATEDSTWIEVGPWVCV
jgi:hypothetical protein